MLLVHVEGFLEVARQGSVSRAAQALYVTQPTLTARLHALERELGARLFVRARTGMRLTDAGRSFQPFAERAVRALRDGRQSLQELDSGTAGQLQIAAAPAVSTYILPSVLEAFVAAHPRALVAVRTGHSEDVLEAVLKDEAQIGIGRALHHPDVELRPLYEEELALVVAPSHRFARRGRVAMTEVGAEQVIMFDRTSGYYEVTQAAFMASGVTLRSLMEMDNIEAAKKMVERGLGVSLLPSTAIAREVASGSLRRVELAGAPSMRRSIVTMRRRDAGPPSGLMAALLLLLEGRPRVS
ncbi:MAG: LysR substrate-binding domain-containing protein [Candidatus Dormibacteraeota bacterium]|nr:LysR substrate-binding domain-containing protein [Candidatus Dormibacteraeota bacterium]